MLRPAGVRHPATQQRAAASATDEQHRSLQSDDSAMGYQRRAQRSQGGMRRLSSSIEVALEAC